MSISDRKQILVTGATGYVGGRLVNSLLSENLDVKIFVRDVNKAKSHSWAKKVNIATGNALNYQATLTALTGVHTAFYLLHSINLGSNFDKIEASFAPRGTGGHLYWWLIKPFHNFIFPTMIKNIIRSSKQRDHKENRDKNASI